MYLFGCLVFVIIGALQISRHDHSAIGWLCVLFFGLGAGVFAIQFIPSASYLRIQSEGFMFCSLFRKSPMIPWQEVSSFRVASVPPSGHRMVVFDRHTASNRGLRQINRHLVDATDGLPDSYGLRPEELANLLNIWRSEHGSTHERKVGDAWI